MPEDGLVDWEREEMEPWEPDRRERCDSDVGVLECNCCVMLPFDEPAEETDLVDAVTRTLEASRPACLGEERVADEVERRLRWRAAAVLGDVMVR